MNAPANFGDGRLPIRYWDKVQPCPMSGCWLWAACIRSDTGMPLYSHDHTTSYAHRVSYAALRGALPRNHDLIHTCEIRTCVNPAHMRLQIRPTHAELLVYKSRWAHANRPRLRRYGLNAKAYDGMLEKQGNACAICRETFPDRPGAVQIDHCHKTNTVRGLLCANCNYAIGHLRDDPERIMRAAEYVAAAQHQVTTGDVYRLPPPGRLPLICSLCGVAGHNKRTCRRRQLPNSL